MVKKIYNQPTCLVVELGCRFALLGLSGNLDGTSNGGSTSEKEGGFPDGGDVKGIADSNLWDNEW